MVASRAKRSFHHERSGASVRWQLGMLEMIVSIRHAGDIQ